ncbi:MAG: hypothetical protein KJ600_00455 [Nanoarchaeota archaeon]|nr:hypothetical protein [Nanoarchaeota archaeon]MBU1103014.1 hypothetical protein [Nanoarchaeota archaeon]
MPPISQTKKDKIAEQILHHLFSVSPQPIFTAQIAREIARDEEFTKSLLIDLNLKGLIAEVNQNNLGLKYLRRKRWRLSNLTYEAYNKQQTPQQNL